MQKLPTGKSGTENSSTVSRSCSLAKKNQGSFIALVLLFLILCPSLAWAVTWSSYDNSLGTTGNWSGTLTLRGHASARATGAESVYSAAFWLPAGYYYFDWDDDRGNSHSWGFTFSTSKWTRIQTGYYPRLQTSTNYVDPDSDGDGITDTFDQCAGTPAGDPVDALGCPPEPDYCDNGVRDWDDTTETWLEAGTDCGGACYKTSCVSTCPAGYSIETRQGLDYCYANDDNTAHTVPVDSFDNCPAGYYNSLTDSALCVDTGGMPVDMDPALLTLPPEPEANPNPWNSQAGTSTSDTTYNTVTLDGVTTDTETTTSSTTDLEGEQTNVTTITETVTNVDNSTTVTTTETTAIQNPDGSSATRVTVKTDDFNAAGQPTGTTTTETSDESDEGAGSSDPLGELTANGVENSAASIDFQPLYDMKDVAEGRFPISLINTMSSVFDTWQEAPDAPLWTFAFPNPYGSNWAFNIDLAPLSDLALVLRQMMACFLVVCGFLLIYKRWV